MKQRVGKTGGRFRCRNTIRDFRNRVSNSFAVVRRILDDVRKCLGQLSNSSLKRWKRFEKEAIGRPGHRSLSLRDYKLHLPRMIGLSRRE